MRINETFYNTICELNKVMEEGEEKYPKNDFLKRGLKHQFQHIKDHLAGVPIDLLANSDKDFNNLLSSKKFSLDLSHAIVRLMMVYEIVSLENVEKT